MPNPRANRPLTLDRVTADLKSLSQPAQALFDMMAGGLRGSAVGTLGAPGDIETLARMGVNAAGGSFNPAMPSRSGRAFQPVSEEPFFPSSEELAKRFAPTIPNGDPVRRKSAEPFEEVGQFAPLPLSGKALKVLPYALGRGTGEVTKEAARMVNDAMLYGQGPLAKVTPQVQRMFIGPQAKVWNHNMAQVAESMEKAGADPVEIWQKTGTFRGADGKLRQEISDKPAQFFDADQIKQRAGEESQAIKDLQMRLLTDPNQKDLFPKLLTEAKKPIRAEVKQRKEALDELHGPRTLPYRGNFAPIAFEHPELYEAYPELKKYLVSQGGGGGSSRGSLMGENIDIYEAGLRGDPRSTMLHEMQHAVQGIEDFAPGGNPAMAFAQPEAMKILEEMRLKALKPMSFEDYADRYSHLANKEKGYEEYLKSIPGIVKKMDRELQTEAAMEYYKRLAGEAEARATQERMNMSPSERQQTFPYGSYDVLEEDLIVKPPKNQLPTNEEGMAAGGLLKGIKAIRKGALSAERSMPARGALSFADEPVAGPSVIKEKGGNWLSGSVEQAVKPLKKYDLPDLFPEFGEPPQNSDANKAVNQWVERNLTNYIKKEMATPEDPVRMLAEEGVTHLPAGTPMPRNMSSVWASREAAGFPAAMGTSREAQAWEAMSDKPVGFGTAGEMINTGRGEPWMEKVDPFTRVHGIAPMESGNMARDLGFDHIVDVLKADLAAGRIRPEQLNKVSMEQAVRRTYEYDQEMAKKMREAQIKATEGMPVHKEYPEGYKWVELAPPKMPDVLPEGWSEPIQKGNSLQTVSPEGKIVLGFDLPDLVKNIYRRHPETPGNPEKVLEDALKYEGDTMGHCVGDYCPDVIKGYKRIYSLRDTKGEPHVTVEVRPRSQRVAPRHEEVLAEMKASGVDMGNLSEPAYDAAYEQALQRVKDSRPPEIIQIKGKGNRAPKEEYLPFVQDFVKGGKWSDVGDLQNTGLQKVGEGLPPGFAEWMRLKALGNEPKIPAGYYTPEELMQFGSESGLKEAHPSVYQKWRENLGLPSEDGMKRGGSVHISDNPDTMMMELGDKHFQVGGIVDLAARAAKAAKAAKPNLVIKSKPGIVVTNLIDEEPDIAKRLGAEARAKRQAAIEAEGQRKQLAAQTQPSVGYRPSTPQKPDPLVGTRFVNEPEFGLNPNEPFDIAKFKGGSGMVLPWDSQSRNVKTTQVSGVDLPNQIFDVTHGGIPYAFDTAHVSKGVAGASGLDIAKRVKNRADTAVQESIGRGGTGELLHFPITMGFRAEDYALPYSEFSFDIINHKLMTGELTQKEADELTKMVRNFEPPKYKGKKPFENFAGFTNPEGLDQIYTGQGLKVPSGELRKAIADRIIWQKGSQEKLGFNAEDLMNATTYEPLRGVDKGFIGSTVMRNSPGGMRLSPSAGKYPYDTDFSGEHLGRLEDLIDVEALFHRTLNPIKRELITRENLKPYNKESLRNAAIGAIEKRSEGISQPIDQQFLDDYADYLNELKKPHEYKKGGAITVKPKQDGKKFKPGKKPDPILKHGQAMPRGKDPVVDISQMAPMMMAGGGEVNADDLILEERPL